MRWPLLLQPQLFPDAPGRFGAVRRHDIHTGVDLYCPLHTTVLAMESGVVRAVEPFTGAWVPEEPTPWWNDTAALIVEGASGILVYGEVGPAEVWVRPGDRVQEGQPLAQVQVPVLKRDKGRPTVMLHLERYASLPPSGPCTVSWPLQSRRPERLLDPTPLLEPLSTRIHVHGSLPWKISS